METFCREFWLCNAFAPPQWHWLFALIVPVTAIILFAVPVANILRRSGHSAWWTILAFIPLVNLVCLWVFAFARWPALEASASARRP